ncbi:aminotransferase class I/II-fold pyridoxal phosphate-dependent enzyme [Pseudonocardia nematodicida]|uniref:cysteine-S-conjugate beta-lyase n=1 Tax=Pseudonocardia nematodicida TaxID=1206997 RepID=A0ABV1KAM3_9PSEU
MTRPDPLAALTLPELRRRTSMKWRTHADDVLPLWVAEADVPLAPAIVDAVTAAVRGGDTGYPCGTGYAEALAGFARDRWGWDGIDPARTRLVPDVMQGIVEVLRALTPPGDAVVVTPPVYPPFHEFLRHAGWHVFEAPLTPDGRLDPASLERAFTYRRARAFLLCSPHNPTGTVHTADELAGVAALAGRHGVTVVADEIHAPLVDPGTTFTPWLSVPGSERGFSLQSASKGWNLAGLKAAVAVAGPGAGEALGRIPVEMLAVGASHVAVQAHVAALNGARDWLDGFVAGIARNRAALAELLAARLPSVGHRPAPATFLAWLDCREAGLGDDPAAVFLERGRVALNDGRAFGTGGAGHVRLNLGTTPEILDEAVRRMAGAVS